MKMLLSDAMEIVLGRLTPFLTLLLLPVLPCVSVALNSPRSKSFNFFSSNRYLEIFASGCKQHEKCSGKCQNKVTANIPRSSNTSRSFPYYGQGNIPLLDLLGCFLMPSKTARSVTPCTLQGSPMYHPGTLPGFAKNGDRGERKNDLSPELWVHLGEFCCVGVLPSISASQCELTFPSSVSSEGCSFSQFISKHSNSS